MACKIDRCQCLRGHTEIKDCSKSCNSAERKDAELDDCECISEESRDLLEGQEAQDKLQEITKLKLEYVREYDRLGAKRCRKSGFRRADVKIGHAIYQRFRGLVEPPKQQVKKLPKQNLDFDGDGGLLEMQDLLPGRREHSTRAPQEGAARSNEDGTAIATALPQVGIARSNEGRTAIDIEDPQEAVARSDEDGTAIDTEDTRGEVNASSSSSNKSEHTQEAGFGLDHDTDWIKYWIALMPAASDEVARQSAVALVHHDGFADRAGPRALVPEGYRSLFEEVMKLATEQVEASVADEALTAMESPAERDVTELETSSSSAIEHQQIRTSDEWLQELRQLRPPTGFSFVSEDENEATKRAESCHME